MSSGPKLIFSQQPLAGASALVFGASVTPAAPKDRRALVFWELVTDVAGIGTLVFKGDTGELPPVAITDINLRATGQITGLRGCITLRSNAVVRATGTLSGLRGHITVRTAPVLRGTGRITGLRGFVAAKYDINTARPVVMQGYASWQNADQQQGVAWAGYGNATTTSTGPHARLQSARQLVAAQTHTTWQRTVLRRGLFSVVLQHAQPMSTALLQCWQSAIALQAAILTRYSDTIRTSSELITSHWQVAYRDRQSGFFSDWQDATSIASIASGVWQHLGNAHDLLRAMRLQHQDAAKVHPGKNQHLPPPGLTPQCYAPDPRLLFNASLSKSTALVFSCECKAAGPLARIVIPLLRTYVATNSISLHRADTGIELHAYSFSMQLDADSWTWSWRATLHQDAQNHLGRDAQGDPPELSVSINGIPFRLRLTSASRDRRFGQVRWSVSGKGHAAILGAPYAPRMVFSNAADRTAQQLMADVLTINGVSLGWSVDWGLTDWLVPAGAWSMQGSYIDAINDIAQAAGGYVQPHATDAVLRVLPRYPAAPWAWASIAPDFDIPAAAAELENTQYVDKPAYERVFVGGVGMGVFGPVTKSGTAGGVLAPQVTHALITHADAQRQRGLAELSDSGQQEHMTLKMQVLPATGIILPGQFVRYRGDKTVTGIVRSTSIDWAHPVLRQTIGIETHA